MASQVDICNMALGNVGQSQIIADLNEASLAAQQCALWYPIALDQLLRDGAWSFSITYVALALVPTAPTTDYLYAYRQPADCITPLRILTGNRVEASPIVYRVTSDSAGLLILTDQASAILQYTRRLSDPSIFAPDFVEALALKLAYHICMPLSVSRERRAEIGKEFERAKSRARTNDANAAVQDPAPAAEMIAIRSLTWPNATNTDLT